MKKKIIIILSTFITILILVAGAGITLVAQQKEHTGIEEIYNKGIESHKNKNYKLFLESFLKLNELVPNHPRVLYNLAAAYTLNNKISEAFGILDKLVIINGDLKITEDTDFDKLRSFPKYQKLISRIKEINTPILTSETAFVIKERDLHPESIGYDNQNNRFYLSSVHKCKIVTIDSGGKVSDFTRSKQNGLDAVLGLRIDSENRVLWAASTAARQMVGYDESKDKGRTGVFKYNLDSKQLIKKYLLKDTDDHGFDDVVLHPGGDLYISDNRAVYRIPKETDCLELAFQDKRFRSVQGIDFFDNGKKMVLADYSAGIFIVDIESGAITPLEYNDTHLTLRGIDGLYYHNKSNSLIAIHNGVSPQRIMQYFLNSDLNRIIGNRIVEKANPLFNEPTLGVVVNDTFYYIANSQWKSYDKHFVIFPNHKLQDIVILKANIINVINN